MYTLNMRVKVVKTFQKFERYATATAYFLLEPTSEPIPAPVTHGEVAKNRSADTLRTTERAHTPKIPSPEGGRLSLGKNPGSPGPPATMCEAGTTRLNSNLKYQEVNTIKCYSLGLRK